MTASTERLGLSWIQGSNAPLRGHELRARIRRWVELKTSTPKHLFDHTKIYRVDGCTVIETEPYTDLTTTQLEQAFSGFNQHGWSVRIETSERPSDCVRLVLTSPQGWILPAGSELGMTRKGEQMANYFLP